MNIGWYMNGNRNTASSRIMGYMISDWMNHNNINSKILSFPDVDFTLNAIIFQKIIHPGLVAIINKYKQNNIKTYFILDDLYAEAIPALQIIDVTIFGSSYLQDYFKSYVNNSYVINDAYETPRELHKLDYNTNNPLIISWFGTLLHFPQAEAIRPLIESLGFKYITISACKEATKQWNLNTIWQDIIESDIVVIPYLGELPSFELAKGNNRLTQAMVLGLPVISSPIPAYNEIIRNGKNGFICLNNTKEEFAMYLNMLKNEDLRMKIGKQARQDVIDKYNIENIGKKWKEILNVKE